MKKMIMLFTMLLIGVTLFSQTVWNYASTTVPFGRELSIGDQFRVITTGITYQLTVAATAHQTPAAVITAGTVTVVNLNATLLGGVSDTNYVKTTGADYVYGAKTFSTTVTSGMEGVDGKFSMYSEQGATDYSATLNPNAAMTSAANFYLPADEPAATYPLTVTSGGVMGYNNQAVTTTSAVSFLSVSVSGAGYLGYSGETLIDSNYYYDDNSATWAKWVDKVINTPSNYLNLQNLGNISLQNKAGNGQIEVLGRDTSQTQSTANLKSIHSIDGGTWLAGTGAFGTTLTRMAIYIAGATASDIYAVSAVSADGIVRPGAGEQLSYFAKTDSLVILRQTGTTSGLGVSYIRIK